MIFNKSIGINLDELPNILKRDYNKLLKLYDTGNEDLFYVYEEVFEASIKQNYIDGKISKKQQELLFNIIGLY